MLPDTTTKCHRTNFQETCFKCVTEHKCRLWKQITLEHHPETGAPGVSHYDCVYSLQDLYMKDMLRRQVQTTATVDALRKEVQQANSTGMASALMGINSQLQSMANPPALPTAEPPKLLEN